MNANSEDQKIDLAAFAELAGFPVELVKKELFQEEGSNEVSLDELRSAMISYLDSTMLEE